MDAKKIIKKYVMPNAFLRIGGWVLLIVMLFSLFIGFATLGSEEEVTAEFYPDDSETGTMAYIDVAGVSNWLYKYDEATYYSVEDAEGYLYTVRLTDSQYNAMTVQQTYWNRESDTAPVSTYRLEGYVQKTPDDVRSSLAESWDITATEYDQYFGANYLNATTSLSAQNSTPWLIAALFSGMLALFCTIISSRAKKVFKKCCKQLEARCLLEKAAQQLEFTEGHTVLGKNRGILTQDFLFGKGTGAVIPYSDIVWAYKMDQRRNFVVANSYLMVATLYMSAQGVVDMNRNDRDGYIGTALSVISQRNPKALLGYTSENGKAYKAAVKASK